MLSSQSSDTESGEADYAENYSKDPKCSQSVWVCSDVMQWIIISISAAPAISHTSCAIIIICPLRYWSTETPSLTNVIIQNWNILSLDYIWHLMCLITFQHHPSAAPNNVISDGNFLGGKYSRDWLVIFPSCPLPLKLIQGHPLLELVLIISEMISFGLFTKYDIWSQIHNGQQSCR